MKAILLTGVGTEENLIYKSINTPRPSLSEALIKIKYCGLNHLDLLIKQGKRPGPKSFPHILGSEIVGYVAALGNKNFDFKIGDAVAVYPWTFCGECKPCLSGNENICDHGGTIGRTSWGGYAEFAAVPIKNLVKIPKKLSLEAVCASTLVATTACHLIDRAKIKDRTLVLITGATGGVGTSIIQLLKTKKCKIICSTSHKNKSNLLKQLGADHIVLTDRLVAEVKQMCTSGVEFAIDIMGGNVWSNAVEILAKNGTLVYCATTLDGMGSVNIGGSFSRQVNILGSYGGRITDLKMVIKLLANRTLKPLIDSVYPLEKADAALKKLDQQKVFGKILLRI